MTAQIEDRSCPYYTPPVQFVIKQLGNPGTPKPGAQRAYVPNAKNGA